MRERDTQSFFWGVVRMSPNQFKHLPELMQPMIMKKNEVVAPIPPDERLTVALRFVASDESQTSLSYCFKIGKKLYAE